MFTLVGQLAAEIAMLRPGISAPRLGQLGMVDVAYGATAGIVIVVGFARVFFGASGPVFWAKIGAFVLVGLLSVPPTIAIGGWRKAARATADFTPLPSAIAGVRRFHFAQVAVFASIPVFAAAMARGYGL